MKLKMQSMKGGKYLIKMAARKRPGQHKKRVHTKRGIKIATINSGIPLAVQKRIVTDNYTGLVRELKQKKKVRIPGIGILAIKTKPARKARMGRNPATGEQMMFKAKPKSKVVKFRTAKILKESI